MKLSKHQQKAIDRAAIIRQMHRDGERLTVASIAARLGVREGAISQIYASFVRWGLEVPDYERQHPGRSSKWRDAPLDQMFREGVPVTKQFSGLPVLAGDHPAGSRRIPGTNLAVYRVR